MKNKLIVFLASGFGLGFAPLAPGTVGTLLGVPLFWVLQPKGPIAYMIFTFLLALFACFLSELAGRILGQSDSPHIVIDEVVGFLVTMVWLPRTAQALVAGFILFRFFDALKPGPIGYLDRKIKGGVGVVVDDVAAGIISNIVLQIVYSYTSWLG